MTRKKKKKKRKDIHHNVYKKLSHSRTCAPEKSIWVLVYEKTENATKPTKIGIVLYLCNK